MLYCPKCHKEVFMFTMPLGVPGANKGIETAQKEAQKRSALTLFNPPNILPYRCPACGTELIEK